MCIFLDDEDYRQFVYLLGDVVDSFDIECWNYCAMPNHYHSTLKPTRPNLSEAIRRLNSVYAQWWNKRHGRVGHVFQGRFKDQVVEAESYLLTLSRYVVMNPVRAGLVERPEEWPWSSYSATMGFSPCQSFLATTSTLRLLGDDDESILRERFASFVSTQSDEQSLVDRIRSNERILGSRAFKDWVRASTRPQTDASDRPLVIEAASCASAP
jgi:REP-associated tyrosine transposase